MKEILLNIEAIIFAAEEGIGASEIKQVLEDALAIDINRQEVVDLLAKIAEKYESEEQVFHLREINNQYQFLTKERYHEVVNQLQAHKDRKKLSQSALETLAIIAYRQPITKLEVEQIRGVNCDYSIQRLLEKKLVQIAGKSDSIGKPLLYATSDQFMQHFGVKSAKDLPQLKDIVSEENSIGEISD
ncbi:SMC-Scp complex subunit ScpB [Sphingobacterium griseoflavum]|uniref:Segregation and condensation protein B n=1 Tax=Sphingobacterium griseoflavum TaxID=1474952 RepID=A0ABQ3HR11_9SPHI|nr:SMC-Scp complex subunit ScpB [Sphingobacterium griseoflavum]GHE23284.1 segregation and condensation protein B [Sphingobacterium griseoflavum]